MQFSVPTREATNWSPTPGTAPHIKAFGVIRERVPRENFEVDRESAGEFRFRKGGLIEVAPLVTE